MHSIAGWTARLTPVSFTGVRIDDLFWSPRLRANRQRTLPIEYQQNKATGRIDAFRLDWTPGTEPKPNQFWDSDVAKWIEAVSYSLASHPDPALVALLDTVIALVVSAQQPDGYLNTFYTVVEPQQRWRNLRDGHELYCAGHLIEAAVAHYTATAKRTLLDALCRYADYLDRIFGTDLGQMRGYCGHEEIELALVKLYHVTGEARYLRLATYFVDERGQQPYYFSQEAIARGETSAEYTQNTCEYWQANRPVRELSVVTGHAVRAMYLYAAMADLAGIHGDDELLAACRRIWDDVCLKKMYLTGGIGSSQQTEGFTAPYDLPNFTAYAETCAAIGLVLWNHRLLHLECDSRYADVMERSLYNGVISGVSLDGEKFFYDNPLASTGHHHRQAWFGCACCPPNIARLLASLGSYIYSQGDDDLVVHLYIQGEMTTVLADGTPITLTQQTQYPWDGAVRLTLTPTTVTECTLRLRIPGWCHEATFTVNGTSIIPPVERGYACIRRQWQPGDIVELHLAMPVERIVGHSEITQVAGRVALQRGPIVYCLEGVDHAESVHQLMLAQDAQLIARFEPELLHGVVVIEGEAQVRDQQCWQRALYQPAASITTHTTALRAIPYAVWDNRAPGDMVVWLWQR